MIMKSHPQTGILSLVLGVALLMGMGAGEAMAKKTPVKKCTQVAVSLDRKTATQAKVARDIRQQLKTCGISATEKEVQAAAKQTLNLVGKSKDPEKGVIYIKTRKFTTCTDWGKDEGFCQKL